MKVRRVKAIVENQKEESSNAKVKLKQQKENGSTKGGKAKKSSLKAKNRKMPLIASVERDVLQYIIGQDQQVRQMITAIYRSVYLNSIKSNVLVIGNSGTGKTEMIKQIAKRLNLPYTIEDATKYTKEGYYGEDVIDMVYNLLESCNNNIERARKGIIVIDEIDKKAGHDRNDVAGVEVLKSLLKIIEGMSIEVPKDPKDPYSDLTKFDTKDLIIIFLGAFSGLEKIRDKRLNKGTIGFCDNQHDLEENKGFLKRDLVEYGMPEEFVGRIDTIIEMNKLTKENLATILKSSRLSIFRKYQEELRKRGIKLEYDTKLFEKIAEKSMQLDTGARELSNTVNAMFSEIVYEVFANINKKYRRCKLSLDIVEDNTKFVLS